MKVTNEMMGRLSDKMVEFMKAEGFGPEDGGFIVLVVGRDNHLMAHLASGGMDAVPIVPAVVRAAADTIEAGTAADPEGIVHITYPQSRLG